MLKHQSPENYLLSGGKERTLSENVLCCLQQHRIKRHPALTEHARVKTDFLTLVNPNQDP